MHKSQLKNIIKCLFFTLTILSESFTVNADGPNLKDNLLKSQQDMYNKLVQEGKEQKINNLYARINAILKRGKPYKDVIIEIDNFLAAEREPDVKIIESYIIGFGNLGNAIILNKKRLMKFTSTANASICKTFSQMGYHDITNVKLDTRVCSFFGEKIGNHIRNYASKNWIIIEKRFETLHQEQAESLNETDQTMDYSGDEINQLIRNTIDLPNKENVLKLFSVSFSRISDNQRLNIHRHLGILSNRGNPFASIVLNRPKLNDVFEAEAVIDNEELKANIYEYNKNINEEFKKYMKENYEYYISELYGEGNEQDYPASFFGDLTIKNQIYRKDLLRIRKKGFARCFWANPSTVSKLPYFGWKLHISAQPNSAVKIASIVLPYLKENNINYKICGSIDALRKLNASSEYTQQGKFISIYTDGPHQAKQITNDLDALLYKAIQENVLMRCDFCELLGDVKIGNTGALYARLGAYKENVDEGLPDYEARKIPVNSNFISKFYPMYQGSPFDLDVSFLGIDLNKRAVDIYKEWVPKVESILKMELYDNMNQSNCF